MHHLETLIQAIPPAVFAAGGSLPSIPPGHPACDSSASPIAPPMFPDGIPSGVPPPSLHVFPLMNPSMHFTYDNKVDERHHSPHNSIDDLLGGSHHSSPSHTSSNHNGEDQCSRVSLAGSYLYFDDEGYTRWQGETSGLPVLDLLVERHNPLSNRDLRNHSDSPSTKMENGANPEWFPNRQPQRNDANPQTFWKLITTYIAPKLMDRCDTLTNGLLLKLTRFSSLVQCYLSTSYYILPFLHVPTFLAVRLHL